MFNVNTQHKDLPQFNRSLHGEISVNRVAKYSPTDLLAVKTKGSESKGIKDLLGFLLNGIRHDGRRSKVIDHRLSSSYNKSSVL
jgi:hypothetical protein